MREVQSDARKLQATVSEGRDHPCQPLSLLQLARLSRGLEQEETRTCGVSKWVGHVRVVRQGTHTEPNSPTASILLNVSLLLHTVLRSAPIWLVNMTHTTQE